MALEKTFRQVKSNFITGKSDKLDDRYLSPVIFASRDRIYGRGRKLIQALNNHILHLEVIIDEQESNYRDLTALARELQSARDLALALFDTIRKPSLVLDFQLVVVTANRAFYRLFEVVPTEVEGKAFETLANGQWQSPRLRACLENVLLYDTYVRDFAVEHPFDRIGQKTMLLDAHRTTDFGTDRSVLVEISEHQQLATAIKTQDETENPVKDLFLSLLSGRLNHPLGITVGCSELIRHVRLIANHGRCSEDRSGLNTIVDRQLDPDPDRIEISPVIEAAIANTVLTATIENTQSQNPITPFAPQHIGKSTRLEQVLQQLLSNAVKFDRLDG